MNTIQRVRVRHMFNGQYRAVKNQFLIYTDEGIYFQSYETVIAYIPKEGQTLLDKSWDCSKTTSKYRAIFLNEDTKTTREKIESGEYGLEDLNNKGE